MTRSFTRGLRHTSRLGATALAGFALLGAGFGFIGTSAASASAVGCAGAEGSTGAEQCMDLSGSGQWVASVHESYEAGAAYNQVCDTQGTWWGTGEEGNGVQYWSSYSASCYPIEGSAGPDVIDSYFFPYSEFYGSFRASTSGGNWMPAVAEEIGGPTCPPEAIGGCTTL